MKEYVAFMEKWVPNDKPGDFVLWAANHLAGVAHVLKQCGDELSRDNILKQATSLRGAALSR